MTPSGYIYLIGSLRGVRVPAVASTLRREGFRVFDDWYAAGPEADDYWMNYEKARGNDFQGALQGAAAHNVFQFDRRHLEAADVAVLVLPAGKSGHLELGWHLGRKKPGYILLDGEPDRYDVMYGFASGVCRNVEELVEMLRATK